MKHRPDWGWILGLVAVAITFGLWAVGLWVMFDVVFR